MAALKYYREKVEAALEEKCYEIIFLLRKKLILPDIKNLNAKTIKKNVMEVQVYYLKMLGDYYRYLCEFANSEQ